MCLELINERCDVSAIWVEVGDSNAVRFWRVTLCPVVKEHLLITHTVAHLGAYTRNDLKASVQTKSPSSKIRTEQCLAKCRFGLKGCWD